MFAVKGIYDGKSVVVKEPIPLAVAEQYEVVVTFLSSINSDKEYKLEDDERKKAFDFLMEFPKKSLPNDFDYKRELTNAIREKYGSINCENSLNSDSDKMNDVCKSC
jgi:hypothetical protein